MKPTPEEIKTVCGCAFDDAPRNLNVLDALEWCRQFADTGEEGEIDGKQLEVLIQRAQRP